MSSRLLSGFLLATQFLDFGLHAASGQLEPLRVASNLVLAIWLLARGAQKSFRQQRLGLAALCAYLILNGIFLLQEGLTNPGQGGQIRFAMIALVLVSTTLSALLFRRKTD